ncbi:hypothetical protein D3C80_1527740 [compost metagenome]
MVSRSGRWAANTSPVDELSSGSTEPIWVTTVTARTAGSMLTTVAPWLPHTAIKQLSLSSSRNCDSGSAAIFSTSMLANAANPTRNASRPRP